MIGPAAQDLLAGIALGSAFAGLILRILDLVRAIRRRRPDRDESSPEDPGAA